MTCDVFGGTLNLAQLFWPPSSKSVLFCHIAVRLGTTKIFVGNIRDGTTSESLRELFECYGRVTEADVLSGFGFVVSIAVSFRRYCRVKIRSRNDTSICESDIAICCKQYCFQVLYESFFAGVWLSLIIWIMWYKNTFSTIRMRSQWHIPRLLGPWHSLRK